MSLPLDSSRMYQHERDFVDLVEAVVQTDPNNESTWIEWKSHLDLSDKSGHWHLAKHMLGFANRTVSAARAHCAGNAYLIVGAEAGNVGGISPVDHAYLTPKLTRYIGSELRWHAAYVPVSGQMVLVIRVDPPKYGDPIYPLRAQLDNHPKGKIFVRRPGATEGADDFEVDQLVQRVRSGEGGLEISVEPAVSTIERTPNGLDLEDWARAERTATLARPRADARRTTTTGLAGLQINSSLLSMMTGEPDDRSQDDYEQQVDNYLEQYKEALAQRFYWRLWRHEPMKLRLAITNLTETNFSSIEVKIHVPNEVSEWPEELEEFVWGDETPMPKRPAPLGTRKPSPWATAAGLPSYLDLAHPVSPYISPAIGRGPSYRVRNSGSVDIDYTDIDLRPEERLELDPIELLVKVPESTVLQCDWSATAGNVNRRLTGRFALQVVASSVDLSSLDEDVVEADEE